MDAEGEDTPRFTYVAALAAGLFCVGLSYLLWAFLSPVFNTGAHDFGLVAPFALATCYGLAGGAFGLFWPEKTWRWGVWLSAAPVCLVSLLGASAFVFFTLSASALVPACLCSYASARIHLKYTRVG
jgi:hypothetical protein